MRATRKLLPKLQHHRLVDLADYFQIEVLGNHRAIKDCETVLYIYEKLKVLAMEKYNDVDSFGEAFKRSKKI